MNILNHEIKLIIGLGNPSKKYNKTRHNIGFIAIDKYKQHLLNNNNPYIEINKKEYSIIKFLKLNLILFKSLTFMNLSGEPLIKFLKQQEDIKPTNILVIHDDLDIKLGKFKFNLKSPKQHNGVASIECLLTTKNFVRLRLGIDNREGELKNIPGKKYVLSKFTKEEYDKLFETIQKTLIELF